MTGQFQIDFIAVLLATVLGFVIGGVWYSRYLFGHLYYRLCKIEKNRGKISSFILEFFAILITAFMMSFLISLLQVTTVTDGMFIGFCLWLGFVVPVQYSKVLFEKMPFRAFLIQTTHRLFAFISMGGLIGA